MPEFRVTQRNDLNKLYLVEKVTEMTRKLELYGWPKRRPLDLVIKYIPDEQTLAGTTLLMAPCQIVAFPWRKTQRPTKIYGDFEKNLTDPCSNSQML